MTIFMMGEVDPMQKKSALLGLIAGALSIILWFVLNFANPYTIQSETDAFLITFVMLVLPASLAIISYIKSRKILMLIAFIWSLPISLYLLATPGIFFVFGITSFSYLLSYFFMQKNNVCSK